jgi:mycothiol system anti-sigma-R factor
MEDAPMTCDNVLHQLYAYLDGALDEGSTAAVQHHLATCQPCRMEVEAVRSLEQRLRLTFRHEPVPATLWPRIVADLEQQASPKPGTGQHQRLLPRFWLTVAAAGLLLVLGASFFHRAVLLPRARDAHVLSVPVHDFHTFVVSQRALDVADADPHHLRQWFQGKVDFPPPLLPVHVGTARLVGARLCYFLNRRVASFMYTTNGHYLSLFVMPRQGLRFPPDNGVSLPRSPARVYEVQGYTHILWFHTDLLYSLVSDVPQAQFIEVMQGLQAESRAF